MSLAQREPMSMAQTILEHFTTVMAGARKALERVPFGRAEWAEADRFTSAWGN